MLRVVAGRMAFRLVAALLVALLVALVVGLPGPGHARADERPAPLTPAQAADKIAAAHATGNQADLQALAALDEPEPWVVAEELCDRGQHDAAEAFARAAPRKLVEGLPDYVASRRGKPADEDGRARLDRALEAAAAGKWADVLAAVGTEQGKLDTVVRLRSAFARGIAYSATGRKRESTATLAEVGRAAEHLGWFGIASSAFYTAGLDAYRISDWAAALSAWQARLEILLLLDDTAGVARTLGSLGNVHLNRGEYAEARTRHLASLALKRKLGDTRGIARTLGSMGVIERSLGNYEQALAYNEESLAIARSLGDKSGVAGMLGNIGNVHLARGDYRLALRHQEEALAAFTSLGEKRSMALALNSIADVQYTLGNYEQALAGRTAARDLFVAAGDRQNAARALGGIGSTHLALGHYAEALARYEEALDLARKLGDGAAVTAWLACLGVMQSNLGNHPKALARYEESLAQARARGERQSIALALMNIGGVRSTLGDYAEALAYYEEALQIRQAHGDKAGVARILLNIGIMHGNQGAYALSRARHEDALARLRALEDRPGAANALVGLGFAQWHLGKLAESATAYEEALRSLGVTGNPASRALALSGLSEVRLLQARPGEALGIARDGIETVSRLVQGLAEGEGAGARDTYASLFDAGMRAALVAGDTDVQAWMLEHGRAGSLRESLGGRQSLQAAVVPKDLAEALVLADLTERRARDAHVEAVRAGEPEDVRRAAAALAKAQGDVQDVVARMQRDAKAAAALVLPAPDDLHKIRTYLRTGEALVLYGLTTTDAMALVLDAHGARMVRLGTSKDVRAAVDALLLDKAPHVDPQGVAALANLVVTPLKLGSDVKRVLVSPAGRLGYVPFGLLLPDREVAFVPSGTTLGLLLQEQAKRGEKVLAVGDPDYVTLSNPEAVALHRGGAPESLRPLPGTRAEAEAVADVTLLGAAATEAGFRAALLQQARWRAVHLACHGWVNPERPMLCALALTATAEADGLLTCLDVFRMRIPSDLVVLSACETGKGKVYTTEGIVGLARAFMFAGTPRVICSLWKVDDEATRALMVKFYELWNGKDALSAAAALRRAQAFVRTFVREDVDVEASQKAGRTVTKRTTPWQHPSYWAAWVLWGLPE